MNAIVEQPPPNPVPFRPTTKMARDIANLSKRTGLPKSFIMRRCVEFALPLMVKGEVPIVEGLPQQRSASQEVGA